MGRGAALGVAGAGGSQEKRPIDFGLAPYRRLATSMDSYSLVLTSITGTPSFDAQISQGERE